VGLGRRRGRRPVTRIYSRGTPIERAMKHVVVDEAGCWIWNGSRTPAGYGNMNLGNGKYGHAHRVTYEHHHGPIPDGLVLDHLCRVRECVNPSHLEAVTERENLRRGESPAWRSHNSGVCQRGHSLADARRHPDGRVINCRTCRREKRESGEWS
jgi:hypothetical protein